MAAMSDDDDMEPRMKAVDNYYFINEDDTPVSFDVLPFQFDAAEEVPSFKEDVYLRGLTSSGLQVYKQVVAWKLGLNGELPEIMVLSTEGSWIALLKPRTSYEDIVRSVLITARMLHFVRRSPTVSEMDIWDHLCRVFNKYDVRPSEDEIKNHVPLIQLFVERDPAIAKSQTLQLFVKEKKEKIDEVVSDDHKHLFSADNKEREEMVEDDSKHETSNGDEDEDAEDGDLFDSICAICDNGGDLLCCEGSCMRSFHAKIGDGEDSYCATLGYTETEVKAIKNFLCKNCEYKQHQCFVCGVLENSDGPNAKVFLCNNATCGHFYHPKCVAQLLHANNKNEASDLEKKIVAGFSFTCPVHWCFECKGLENRTQEPLQFAVCRRCPRSYHRKCLPSEICFGDDEGSITRAWELSKRILIYCMNHDIDLDIGTAPRDHLKFPRTAKPVDSAKKKVRELAKKKRRSCDDSHIDETMQKSSIRVGRHSSFEQPIFQPQKKKAKCLKEMVQSEEPLVKCATVVSSPKQPAKEQEQQLGTLSSLVIGETPDSSFPVIDNDTEKRVIALVEKEVSSLTLDNISQRCAIPSTYATNGRQIDKIAAHGKLEGFVQAVQAALQKLEKGGSVDDAKAVCEVDVLRQLARWHNKLKVYLGPFIHGPRYTSYGRHFTKTEKLIEIVNKVHWYVQPGDMIVDFSCGQNDFSQCMKEKLDKVGKKCNFKNYDVIQPKNAFCFEKRDWMTVLPKELPHGSKLIMGLSPPFGFKAMLANKFIDKALTFKPKLIILIVPKETERLDNKRQPYDLIWEDTASLSGKSFYLPGSLDSTDKQIDQWNACPPVLCLWSRPDWTQKHKRVAEQHGHTKLKVVSRAKAKNQRELLYKQNGSLGHGNGTYMSENTDDVGKPVEVAYDETKVASETTGPPGFEIGCPSDKRQEIAPDCSRRIGESVNTGYAFKSDSDMSISPSDSRNSWDKSGGDLHMASDYPPSGTMTPLGNCFSDPPPEPWSSPLGNIPDEDYIRNVAEHGVASVEKHLAFCTDNVGAGLRMQSPDLEELNLQQLRCVYAGGANSNCYSPGSGVTGGLTSGRSLGSMENTGSAQRNADVRMYSGHFRGDDTLSATDSIDIRAQIRMYGGQVEDDHPRRAMNPPADDIRAQVRMYGQQSTHTSGYNGSSGVPPAFTSSSLSSAGRFAMDMYAPHLNNQTNYTTGPYNFPGNRRDRTPDAFDLASRQRYPYPPHPGSSGGWLG